MVTATDTGRIDVGDDRDRSAGHRGMHLRDVARLVTGERSQFMAEALSILAEVDADLKRIGSTSPDRKITIAQIYTLLAIADALEALVSDDEVT